MYTMTISLTTPGAPAEDKPPYVLRLEAKKELHKVEKALVKGLEHLVKLTADELDSGKKPFDKTDPQLMFFEVNIDKDGTDYGGYKHRWPNQSVEAREWLRNLLAGLMDGVGHGKANKSK